MSFGKNKSLRTTVIKKGKVGLKGLKDKQVFWTTAYPEVIIV